LDTGAAYSSFITTLPNHLQSKYSIDEFRMAFRGVRYFGPCGNGWLGQRYLMEFAKHVRQLSNAFYVKHPHMLRSGTINDDD
jgi:hypothetical protein